ncbi:MAG: PilZ domain-containing protein, partial [bacterium]|nr:PilZ domain-containing protein [bacterium]
AEGADWALWAPLDDSELRFVVNSAMALPYEVARRTTLRAPTSLVTSVSAAGRHAIGNLSSLSEGGAFVELQDLPSRGVAIGLGFTLNDMTIEAEGRVVFVSSRAHAWAPCFPRGVGVEFSEIHPDAKEVIHRYIKERLAEFTP